MSNKEIDKTIQMIKIRSEVGRVIQVDQEFITEMESNLSDDIGSVRDVIERYIAWLTESGITKLKSRPLLSAFCVLQTMKKITNYAEGHLVRGELKEFIFFYDYALGASFAINPIFAGEGVLRGDVEEGLVTTVEAAGDAYDFDVSRKAEAYLSGMKKYDAAKQLLIEDPSGFILVDESVKHVCGEDSRIPSFKPALRKGTNKQIARAGVVYGAKFYKEVYGALETLYS